MKRIVSFSCLVWLVCISIVASSEQTADHHHHDEDATAMKGVDSTLKETRGNAAEGEGKKNGKLAGFNMWDVPSTNHQERGMKSNYDSSMESGSFEDGDIQDRGLFDMFDSPGRQRRRRGGMFSPVPYGRGGYGRGRGGRSPYNQQPYADPRYDAGMGYGSGGPYGYGGGRRFPQGGQYQPGPYSNRLGQYQGGRGGRMGSPRYGGYPGAGGYSDQQSYRQPYYRDLPTESNTPAEAVVA